MSHYKIAPSILAADYANFEKELKRLEKTGVEYVHIDVMDGHFVPNISFGADVVAAMRPHSKLVSIAISWCPILKIILRPLLEQVQIF